MYITNLQKTPRGGALDTPSFTIILQIKCYYICRSLVLPNPVNFTGNVFRKSMIYPKTTSSKVLHYSRIYLINITIIIFPVSISLIPDVDPLFFVGVLLSRIVEHQLYIDKYVSQDFTPQTCVRVSVILHVILTFLNVLFYWFRCREFTGCCMYNCSIDKVIISSLDTVLFCVTYIR